MALRPRTRGFPAAEVERARLEERSVVRTWAMRGTLHLLPVEDLGWLLPLVGEPLVPGRLKLLAGRGAPPAFVERAVALLPQVLASGPLTPAEIEEELARRGVALPPQTTVAVCVVAGLRGLLCHGPDRGRSPSYVLLADWAPAGPPREPDEALAELTRRYLGAHAPAVPEDLAAWSGLGLRAARRGFELVAGDLRELAGGWAPPGLRASPGDPPVRLLPGFDPWLLGWRTRDHAVSPEHAKRVLPGGGMLRPVLLVDGRVVATWRRERRRGGWEVELEPFRSLPAAVRRAAEADAEDLGRYLEEPVRLKSPRRS
jgi:hypothetical protein